MAQGHGEMRVCSAAEGPHADQTQGRFIQGALVSGSTNCRAMNGRDEIADLFRQGCIP